MTFTGTLPRRRARPSLTPMIDVVFLLLVFFMLAARFGNDAALALAPAATGDAQWQGAPRLVEFDGTALFLNGAPISPAALPAALRDLMPGAEPDLTAPVLMRARGAATLADLTRAMDILRAAGFPTLMVVE